MQILEQSSRGSAQPDRQSLWHFRVIPEDVQQCTVRRLILSGLPEHDIAARTGWSIDRIRQMTLDHVFASESRNVFERATVKHRG